MSKYQSIVDKLNEEFDCNDVYKHTYSGNPFCYEYGDGEEVIDFCNATVYYENEEDVINLSENEVYNICRNQAINYLEVMKLMYENVVQDCSYKDKLKRLDDIANDDKISTKSAMEQWWNDQD
jgi:hypothetical protein